MSAPKSITEVQILIERSGLLGEDVLAPFLALQAHHGPHLIQRFLDERLLTPYQARQLQRGLYKGFFITDKYKVLDFIGAGGMGKVYLCEHLILQRLVALKVLQLASDPGSTDAQ